MQELGTSDEETFAGRHRAGASVPRSGVRLGLAALGVLVATGLGVVTADALGLSDAGNVVAVGDSLRELPPDPEEQPGMRRTVGLSAEPAPPPAASQADAPPADPPAAPPAETPPPDPDAGRAPSPDPDAGRAPSPSPVRVRKGDSCSAVGRTAVTGRGAAAVCTASRGNGPNKWRAA